MTAKTPLEQEVAELIVAAVNLERSAAEIDPLEPLYRDGVGLDSIDMLEMSLAISKQYGFKLRQDAADNARIFASLRALCEHIAASRTR